VIDGTHLVAAAVGAGILACAWGVAQFLGWGAWKVSTSFGWGEVDDEDDTGDGEADGVSEREH